MGNSFLDTIIMILLEFGVPWEPWMAKFLPIPVFILLLPFFLRNIRIAQARKAIKRSNSYYQAKRRSLEVEAIEKVKNIPTALLGLADEAIKMQRYDLAQEIISLVPRNKKYRRELIRIHNKINPPSVQSEQDELIAIEKLIENEVYKAAFLRLQQAQLKWPESSELIELRLRLQTMASESEQ
jgi:hypothetical protein